MNNRLKTTALLWLRRAAAGLALAAFAVIATSRAQVNPDLTFRLLNIERRLDQLQIRVDTIERAQQLQSVSNNSQSLTETLLEVQRQQLALAREVTLAQQQMLQLQKTVDDLSARITAKEKEAKPEEKKPPEKKGQVIKDKSQ